MPTMIEEPVAPPGVVEEQPMEPANTPDSPEDRAPSQGRASKSGASREEPVEPCADLPLTSRIEAMLMASDRPLTEFRIAELLGLSGKGSSKKVVAALEELNAHYAESGRAYRAERLAGGWQMLTLPAFGPILHRLHDDRQQSRLSQPALETLAIIAYRQPIMRAEIEAIRGVASGEVLRSLLERRLVKIVGRAEELGRPMLYGTTREFLKVFGLAAIDDLPTVKGLLPNQAAPANRAMTPVDEAEPSSDQSKDAPTDDSASAE
jgi:segregation and condensation protein B